MLVGMTLDAGMFGTLEYIEDDSKSEVMATSSMTCNASLSFDYTWNVKPQKL